MTSPLRPSDYARSTPRSSPSRSRLAEFHRSGSRVNGLSRTESVGSPGLVDSPSRQLLEDFSKIVLEDDLKFKRSLDQQTAEQEKLHRQALDDALAQHEAVRQSAERARLRVELEIVRARKKREEDERQAVEEQRRKLAQEDAERERERLVDVRRQEEDERQKATLQRQRDESERQAETQRQSLEAERAGRERKAAQDKAEADRKAREDAAAVRQRQQQAQQPAPTPQPPAAQPAQPQTNDTHPTVRPTAPAAAQSTSSPLVSSVEQRKVQHKLYMDLWRRLKKFRMTTEKQCKDAGFKDLGEMRREIRKQIGFCSKEDREANRNYLAKIEAVLKRAMTITEPSVDIREFLISVPQAELANATDTKYPAILLYLLNHFGKSVIRALIEGTGENVEHADPLGIMLIQIFARPDYQWNGHSLIDPLWAKYHRLCPQLFGIPAQEGRDEGYFRQVTGLAAGFSAFTLRDFSRSKNKNPAPNTMWWEAMARTLNLPAGQTQLTHYVMLKAMIEEYVPRIITIFGGAGKALLKNAVRNFPPKGPKTQPKRPGDEARMMPHVMALETLQYTLQTKYNITL
ncbi:hypothetical protein LTR78_007786 [Recurvomyces mirabilis]|uniref:mRNA export factor GLE1 n=1 Tax=Recurvomyces mirabilis TaxID=574656 RepID=A0AAE0TR12_9PEZI|nr:hypothetical protein LTR78_007786 [Recurvomyces mirabilis]KAK5160172.1 hypothetical protein LTS14_002279 [Recurvomyces mirabilis]